MNLMQRENELDRMISDALHEIADNLEMSERVKQDKQTQTKVRQEKILDTSFTL